MFLMVIDGVDSGSFSPTQRIDTGTNTTLHTQEHAQNANLTGSGLSCCKSTREAWF